MTVSIWVGRPPSGYEKEHLDSLRRQLAPLDEKYTLLANFIVGQREIDLMVLKHNAMFQIEHKFCNAPLGGNVNGPWRLSLPTGEARDLNGGRENPYQQTLFNFAALTKWLEANKIHFLAPGRAESVRFFGRRDDPGPKPMRIHNLLVISPDLHPNSCLELDWRVKVIGAPALLEHLTQATPRVDLSPEECTAIARELWLSPWQREEGWQVASGKRQVEEPVSVEAVDDLGYEIKAGREGRGVRTPACDCGQGTESEQEGGEAKTEGRGDAEMAALLPLTAAAVVRSQLEVLKGMGANEVTDAPPLRQVLTECWAYLRWSLRSGTVTG